MRALAIAIFVVVSIGSAAHAQQQRSGREMMSDMKEKYGQTFDQCQSLATSRGCRFQESGEDSDARAVAMFIEGCIMGKQH